MDGPRSGQGGEELGIYLVAIAGSISTSTSTSNRPFQRGDVLVRELKVDRECLHDLLFFLDGCYFPIQGRGFT